MSRVMSPDSTRYEATGMQAAFRYYALMSRYTRQRVIESAELLRSHWCQRADVHWHEFANGFVAGALIVAQSRRGGVIEQARLF